MADFYIGDGLLLYLNEGGDFKPMACLTSCGYSESTSFIETCKTSIEGAKAFIPDLNSYTISFQGLLTDTTTIGGDDAKVSWDKLKELQRSKTKIEFTLSNVLVNELGQGFISNLEITAATADFIQFSGSITGSGIIEEAEGIFDNIYSDIFA